MCTINLDHVHLLRNIVVIENSYLILLLYHIMTYVHVHFKLNSKYFREANHKQYIHKLRKRQQ